MHFLNKSNKIVFCNKEKGEIETEDKKKSGWSSKKGGKIRETSTKSREEDTELWGRCGTNSWPTKQDLDCKSGRTGYSWEFILVENGATEG